MDNLADADSLTTIEKEEGEEAAGENEEGQEAAVDEQETGNLSRTGSKSSRRKSKVTVDEPADVESGHLHKTYSVMSRRSRKGQVSSTSLTQSTSLKLYFVSPLLLLFLPPVS